MSRQAEQRLLLRSEFASVALSVDTAGRGPRLLVEDRRSGRKILLDPLEIASLTWLNHNDLGPFLDPGQTGWSSHAEAARTAQTPENRERGEERRRKGETGP